MARLRNNKRAYDHFTRRKAAFTEIAQDILTMSIKYPAINNEATRTALVANWILEFDKSIWSLKNDTMSAQELAETYAMLVVGHENER